MRVLFVPDVYEEGGAFCSFTEMVYNLKENHDIEPVILCSKVGRYTSFAIGNEIEYHVAGYSAFFINLGSRPLIRILKRLFIPIFYVRYKIGNFIALKYVSKYIDMDSIDLIHTNVNRNDIGALLSRKYGKKHIWHIREFGTVADVRGNGYYFYSLRSNYIKFMNNHTDTFLCVSQAVAKQWVAKGIDERKISIVYNGVRSCDQNKVRIRDCNLETNIRIIMLGYICPQKGQSQLIEALKYIGLEKRKRILVDFYGNYHKSYRASLERYVKKLGMTEQIHYKGYDSDVTENLSNYDIGVVATVAEGFGRATAEYMMAGVCVIASNTGANEELVDNGQTGLVYQYGDARDLARCLEKFMDVKFVDATKQKAYVKAINCFTSEQNAQRVFDEYKKLF